MLSHFSLMSSGLRARNNKETAFLLEDIVVSSSVFPALTRANNIIDSMPVNKFSIAWRLKNPGNLRCFKSPSFRKFDKLKDGYEALIHQLDLYTSGRSMWTDSSTTLRQYCKIYCEGEHKKNKYAKFLAKNLKIGINCKISGIQLDSLAKYHIKIEDRRLFSIMYQN